MVLQPGGPVGQRLYFIGNDREVEMSEHKTPEDHTVTILRILKQQPDLRQDVVDQIMLHHHHALALSKQEMLEKAVVELDIDIHTPQIKGLINDCLVSSSL